jgi:hypothetical protein
MDSILFSLDLLPRIIPTREGWCPFILGSLDSEKAIELFADVGFVYQGFRTLMTHSTPTHNATPGLLRLILAGHGARTKFMGRLLSRSVHFPPIFTLPHLALTLVAYLFSSLLLLLHCSRNTLVL